MIACLHEIQSSAHFQLVAGQAVKHGTSAATLLFLIVIAGWHGSHSPVTGMLDAHTLVSFLCAVDAAARVALKC